MLPLAGLRVVDSSDGKAELCARLLADMGADVIRVEPVGGGSSRRVAPFVGRTSLHFATRNTNKKGVVLDLEQKPEQDRFWELLDSADVWIETSSPGRRRDSPAFDPAAVAARLPGLVVTSITDFGQDGPYRDFAATDAVMVAMSWSLHRSGVPELPPALPPGELAYDQASVTGAFATLTAYLHRLRTGRGQHVDLSVIEAVQETTDWALPSYSFISRSGVYGEGRGGNPLWPILRCKDGWIRPSIVSKSEWHNMRAWLGEPEMLQDEYWDESTARVEISDILIPMLEEFFADKSMVEASEEGQRRRIPVTPLLSPSEVLTTAHYEALGTFVDDEAAPGVSGRLAAGFYILDGERLGYRTPAPLLSPHEGPLTTLWDEREPVLAPDLPGGAAGPFDGVRVLDLGTAGAAPEIARLLAEYGADAIKVDNPRRPDLFRQMGPDGMGPLFASSNRSKRSLGADLGTECGLDIVKALIQKSDIIVENLPTGVLDGFGLSWDVIHQLNPDALVISSQTMGSHGPWKDWRGYGANTQPPGGMSYLWAFPDVDRPMPASSAFPDHIVGRLGAVIAAAFVVGRPRIDRGAKIEIVQAEVAINLLSDILLGESIEPGSAQPQGNRSPRGAPWGVYPCAGEQRWCVITCRDDRDWDGLKAALDHPAWADRADYASAAGRRADHDAIDAHLSSWTAARSDTDVMTTLQAFGVPAGKMMYTMDLATDPHLVSRDYVREIEQPPLGRLLVEGPGFHAPDLSGPIEMAAPTLGEHTRQICEGVLGLDSDEVDRLVTERVLHEWHGGDAT